MFARTWGRDSPLAVLFLGSSVILRIGETSVNGDDLTRQGPVAEKKRFPDLTGAYDRPCVRPPSFAGPPSNQSVEVQTE